MKKVLIVIFFLISSFLFSQETDYGIQLGLNLNSYSFSNQTTEDIYSGGPIKSLYAIFYIEAVPEEKSNFSFQIGLGFTSFGGKLYKNEGYIGAASDTYLIIPALVKYNFWNNLSLTGGLEIARLQKQTFHEERKNINTMDIGLNIGLSYHIKRTFVFDIRYNKGLINLYTSNKIKATNNAIFFGVGYTIFRSMHY